MICLTSRKLFIILCSFASIPLAEASDFKVPNTFKVTSAYEEGAKERFFSLPLFKNVVGSSIYFDMAVFDIQNPREARVRAMLTKTSRIGDVNYEPGTVISGGGLFFYRIHFKGSKKFGNIHACGHIGQHAKNRKIFEISLCSDLRLPEGTIPKGSTLGFVGEIPAKKISLSDIFCLKSSKDTILKGKQVTAGIDTTPNLNTWSHPDRSCMNGTD
jgi:hypothetical protein